MYLRHSTRVKDGKAHTYWRLVRSVRHGSKVRQETVAQLGELDAQGRADARALARHITGRGGDQPDLFEDPAPMPAKVEVRLDRVRLERARDFGDVWLGWTLWRALKFDEFCAEHMPEGRESVAWSTMAAILAIARLCEPSSELHIAEDWYRRTALEDLLGVPAEQVNDDRVYRALDKLLPHKTAFEQHLRQRLGELFSLDYDLLLYDVTSTYFEGQARGNPQAKRGHSRDQRPDCKQVCIALVVTREGIPLGYEVFDGNRVDVTTVEEIVSTMEARFGIAGRVWVMDRGMTSAKNIAWLQQTGRRYLIGTPKPTCSSPRPRTPSASTKATCRSGRSGIKSRTACRRTASSASWPTRCGRRSSSGSSAQGSATAHAPSSSSWAASRAPTSCSRLRVTPNARSESDASCVPTALRPRCSIGSDYACPNGSARPARPAKCSADSST